MEFFLLNFFLCEFHIYISLFKGLLKILKGGSPQVNHWLCSCPGKEAVTKPWRRFHAYGCFPFFFFFFLFLQSHLQHMEVPEPGVELELQLRPLPQPEQHGIRATSLSYTTAWGNAGSLTQWVRLGIKPTTSGRQCQVFNLLSHKSSAACGFLTGGIQTYFGKNGFYTKWELFYLS